MEEPPKVKKPLDNGASPCGTRGLISGRGTGLLAGPIDLKLNACNGHPSSERDTRAVRVVVVVGAAAARPGVHLTDDEAIFGSIDHQGRTAVIGLDVLTPLGV